MNDTTVVHLALQTMIVALKLAAPVLITALVVGLGVSLIQSVTQIQESTLSFVPKALAVGVVLLLTGHWMLNVLVSFTTQLYTSVPSLLSGG